MSIELVVSAVVAFLLGLLQTMILFILKDIKRSLDKHDTAIVEMKQAVSKMQGSNESERDLVFREINSEKQKITKIEGRVDALWDTVKGMATKLGIVTDRISDRVKR